MNEADTRDMQAMPVRSRPPARNLIPTLGLAIVFVWFGALKFTQYEAEGIAPLIMNGPLVSWWHATLGIAGAAYVVGVFELATSLLLASRLLNAQLAMIGGIMAAVTFVITLSFLLSTPGVVQPGFSMPLALSAFPGQFLLKDLALLALSIWVALGARADHMRVA